jgi:hypothetical protein
MTHPVGGSKRARIELYLEPDKDTGKITMSLTLPTGKVGKNELLE